MSARFYFDGAGMEPGDLCIIPPGVEHRIYIGEDDLALAFRCSVAAIRQIFVLSRFRDTNTVVAFFSPTV